MLLPSWTAPWLFLLLCGSVHSSSLPPQSSLCQVDCTPREKCLRTIEGDIHSIQCCTLIMRVDNIDYYEQDTTWRCNSKKDGGAYWYEKKATGSARWRTIRTVECIKNLPCSGISSLVSSCHNDHMTCRPPDGFTALDTSQLRCARGGKEWLATTVPGEAEQVHYRMARLDCFQGAWRGVEYNMQGEKYIVPAGSNVRCVKEFERIGNNSVYHQILTEGNNWKARHLTGFALLLIAAIVGVVYTCLAFRIFRACQDRYAREHRNLKPLPFHYVWNIERRRVPRRRRKRKAAKIPPPKPNHVWDHAEQVEEMDTAWEPTEFEMSSDSDEGSIADECEAFDCSDEEGPVGQCDGLYRPAFDFETDVEDMPKDSEVVDSDLSPDSGHSCYDENRSDVDSEEDSEVSLDDDEPLPRDPAVPRLVEVRLDDDYTASSYSDDLSDGRPYADSDDVPTSDSSDDDEHESSEEEEDEDKEGENDDEEESSSDEDDGDEEVNREMKCASDADDEADSDADIGDDDKYCRRQLEKWGDEDDGTDIDAEEDGWKAYVQEYNETKEVDALDKDVPWCVAVPPPARQLPPKYLPMPLTEDQLETAAAMDKFFLKEDRHNLGQEDFEDDDLVEGVTLYNVPDTITPLPPVGTWGEASLLPSAINRLVLHDNEIIGGGVGRGSKFSKKKASMTSIGGYSTYRAKRAREAKASRLVSRRFSVKYDDREKPARSGHSNLIDSQAETRGGSGW